MRLIKLVASFSFKPGNKVALVARMGFIPLSNTLAIFAGESMAVLFRLRSCRVHIDMLIKGEDLVVF